MAKVLLSTASPRRRMWLSDRLQGAEAELDFSSLNADEPSPAAGKGVGFQVEEVCISKAKAAIAEIDDSGGSELPDYIVVADTLVEDPDDSLIAMGKPRDRSSAVSMLLRLSGRRHRVWSSTGILRPPGADLEGAEIKDGWTFGVWTEFSIVEFGDLDEDTMVRLIESDSWAGKAGGYDLAGEAKNVVGLIEGQEVTVLGFSPGAIDYLVKQVC